MVTAGVVELLFLLALACQSSCVLTRISRFRLWASFLRIWLRSFSFTNSDSNDIWRFFCCCPHIRGGATGPVCSALLLSFGVIFTLWSSKHPPSLPITHSAKNYERLQILVPRYGPSSVRPGRSQSRLVAPMDQWEHWAGINSATAGRETSSFII